MFPVLSDSLSDSLPDSKEGVEREALRIDLAGRLASTAHPQSLGSSLTNPHITTDFCEAQLEFTTAPYSHLSGSLQELEYLVRYSCQQIGEELLWPLSMPAELPQREEDIPIAFYGNSALGRFKELYRRGLAVRYGRRMQTITGLHYNFSLDLHSLLPAEKWDLLQDIHTVSGVYLAIIRNFFRIAFLFPYLFGASPALDCSFHAAPHPRLDRWRKRSFYGRYATSLRQTEIGYNHPNQWPLQINYNSLEQYLRSICCAVTTPHPAYQDFSAEQLNDSWLQFENEHYALIRPKEAGKNSRENDRPLRILEQSGIGHLEVRCLDLNPWSPIGVSREELLFTRLVLLDCLSSPSPPLLQPEMEQLRYSYLNVAWEGRNPDCKVVVDKEQRYFRQVALELCNRLDALAERLDREAKSHNNAHNHATDNKLTTGNNHETDDLSFSKVLQQQRQKCKDTQLVPSARILAQMESCQGEYLDWGLELARQHRRELERLSTDDDNFKQSYYQLTNAANESLKLYRQSENATLPAPDLAALPSLC